MAGGSVSALANARPGAAIGLERSAWRADELTLPPGWTILLYTDGIIEGRIGEGSERLGEAGLRRMVAERITRDPAWRSNPQALLQGLLEDAERLNGGALSDDVAMLLLGAQQRDDSRPA